MWTSQLYMNKSAIEKLSLIYPLGTITLQYYYYFNRQIRFSCLISTFADMLCKEFRQLFSLKGRIMTDNKEHFSGCYSLSCATPQGERMKYLYYKSVSVMWERWHYIWKLRSFSGLFIVTFITVLRQERHLMLMVNFTGQINDLLEWMPSCTTARRTCDYILNFLINSACRAE